MRVVNVFLVAAILATVALAGCSQPQATVVPATATPTGAAGSSTPMAGNATLPVPTVPATGAPTATVRPTASPTPAAPGMPRLTNVFSHDPSANSVSITWTVSGTSPISSWVEYGHDYAKPAVQTGPVSGTGVHEVGLDNVVGNYWFEVVAKNAAGTVRSDPLGFSTTTAPATPTGNNDPGDPAKTCNWVAPPPSKQTAPPTIYPFYWGSCPLNMTVSIEKTGPTTALVKIGYETVEGVEWWIDYGPTSSYGTVDPNPHGLTTADKGLLQRTITGLTTGSTYHFRINLRDYDNDPYDDHFAGSPDLTLYM